MSDIKDVVTIQQTARTIKKWIAIAYTAMAIGVLAGVIQTSRQSPIAWVWWIVFFIGLMIYAGAKITAWWKHA